MAEYTANALQLVQPNQNVIFTDTPVSGYWEGIIHREGSGIVTVTGQTNNCCRFSQYTASFDANVAIPEGGAASTPLSFAIAINGEPLQTSTMIVTPPAAEQFWHISVSSNIPLPKGCCYAISVENTGTIATDIQNVSFKIKGGI